SAAALSSEADAAASHGHGRHSLLTPTRLRERLDDHVALPVSGPPRGPVGPRGGSGPASGGVMDALRLAERPDALRPLFATDTRPERGVSARPHLHPTGA